MNMATLELAWTCHKMQRAWHFTNNKNLKNMDNDQWVLKLIIQGSFSNCICSKNLEAFFWWVIIQENLRMPCWLKINNLLGRKHKNVYGWGSMFSPSLFSLSWKNEHAPISMSSSSHESFWFCDNYHLKYLLL